MRTIFLGLVFICLFSASAFGAPDAPELSISRDETGRLQISQRREYTVSRVARSYADLERQKTALEQEITKRQEDLAALETVIAETRRLGLDEPVHVEPK